MRCVGDRAATVARLGGAAFAPWFGNVAFYLSWTMAEAVHKKETLREFRNIQYSMLELCGPFLCYLIISLSFMADVCQRCIELGAGQMILDEMHEIREQQDFVVNTNRDTESSTEPASQDDLNSQLQELAFYMDRHVCGLNHIRCRLLRQYPRKLTSEFMKAMMRMLVVPDDDPCLNLVMCPPPPSAHKASFAGSGTAVAVPEPLHFVLSAFVSLDLSLAFTLCLVCICIFGSFAGTVASHGRREVLVLCQHYRLQGLCTCLVATTAPGGCSRAYPTAVAGRVHDLCPGSSDASNTATMAEWQQ